MTAPATGGVGVNYNIPVTGGDANGQFTSNSSQSLTVNANPIFNAGGSATQGSPSASASDSSAQNPGLTASYPAGPGLATLGTTYPASASAPASLSALTSSPTFLFLIIGVGLLLAMGGGGHRR